MTTTLPTAEQACDLPDDIREPLHSLSADIRYLFGRVAADGTLASMMADSAVSRLSQIEEASYRLNALITAQAAEIERLTKGCEPPLTCPHIDRLLSDVVSPGFRAELEGIRDINSQLRHGLWAQKSRAEAAEADISTCKQALQVAEAERDAMREALETIAESHDAGRHDGLPEPCPAHEAEAMWAVAVAALSLDAQVKREAEPDWWYRTLDPDDAGDSPHEALRNVPDFTVCELLSSYSGPKKFAFRAPTLDPDDDTETLLFDTQEEALAAATERHAVLDAKGEKE